MHRHVTWIAMIAAGLLAATLVTARGQENASCTASCRAQHNQCRIDTKGSPSCDSQLQACLRACLKR